MKLYTKCDYCNSQIFIKASAQDRVELKMKRGNPIRIQCKNCGKDGDHFVETFKARKSKGVRLLAAFLFIVGTSLALLLIFPLMEHFKTHRAIVVLIPFIVIPNILFLIISRIDSQRVNDFNHS